MGLFQRSAEPVRINFGNITLILLLAFIIIQAFGLLFGKLLNFEVALGPIFVLFAIGICSGFSVIVFKKINNDEGVNQKDLLVMIIVTGFAVFIAIYLKRFVPEIFTQGLLQLQSAIGLP